MFVVQAPGRVNLIGDHTDYQDGYCLPVAIDRGVTIEVEPRTDGVVVARSDAFAGVVELPAGGVADPRSVVPSWGRPLAAALHLLARPDRAATGFDAQIASTVPVGSGLSSSAAFAVAVVVTTAEAGGFTIPAAQVAAIARRAEETGTGVRCGIMDQMASVFGQSGHALLLDCRDLAIVPIALPDSATIVVIHTGAARTLEESAYTERREACERAAHRLGVPALRDATPDQVADDPYARHVVSENRRVLEFADALRAGDLERCGALMLASHASLRDDFRVSTRELDTLVAALEEAGAYGARVTGAGFGGCAVALAPADRADEIAARAAARYGSDTGLTPLPFLVRAVDGAGVVR